jgi:hypothetical protein
LQDLHKLLEQFDSTCVQDGAKRQDEGVIFYSVFPLYVFPSAVSHIKMAEKFPRLYPYLPIKSLLPRNVHAKFIQITLYHSKLCSMKSAAEADKNVFIKVLAVCTDCVQS